MPKSKDSTARITMFHKLRIPFVFTLESSFAGANKGVLAGQHFSQGDLEKVGRYVLQAFWEIKKLLLNKSLLKEITAEAQSLQKENNDEDHESDGCSSSEEDIEPPTSVNAKKAIDILQEELSPDKIQMDNASTVGNSPVTATRVTKVPKNFMNLQVVDK